MSIKKDLDDIQHKAWNLSVGNERLDELARLVERLAYCVEQLRDITAAQTDIDWDDEI